MLCDDRVPGRDQIVRLCGFGGTGETTFVKLLSLGRDNTRDKPPPKNLVIHFGENSKNPKLSEVLQNNTKDLALYCMQMRKNELVIVTDLFRQVSAVTSVKRKIKTNKDLVLIALDQSLS